MATLEPYSTGHAWPASLVCLALVLAPFVVTNITVAQVLPDRMVVLDPLGDRSLDSSGITWLNGARMHAEFSRHTPGDDDHRWNARLGGVAELVRWDSSADISLVGTMEIVVDPHNDIAFNPRAIFWEEGVLAGFRLAKDLALQAGYVHRCKHDIDNLEITARGRREQRTLIYSGLLVRLLARRRAIVDDRWRVSVAGSLRNDLFLHLLDDRFASETRAIGRDVETLIDALSLTGRVEAGPRDASWRAQATVSFMASAFGAERGFTERFTRPVVLGTFPFVEIGVDVFNERGAAFSLFGRAESHRDAGVSSIPTASSTFAIGVRIVDARWMW